ncbi:hypothetical protein Thermus77420_24340 [Thermus thalpophilus]
MIWGPTALGGASVLGPFPFGVPPGALGEAWGGREEAYLAGNGAGSLSGAGGVGSLWQSFQA